MNTMTIGDFYVTYNNDFSGLVALEKRGQEAQFSVPFSVLKCLVAAWVQQERVKRVANEEDANKILLPDVPLLSLHKT